MTREFEIIGAGALGTLLHGKAHAAPEPGTLCSNCGAQMQGYYCHVCGQSAHDTHRSIWRLAWEGIEGLTHLDGRLGQTLPALFLNPGKLARDHFEGRRQRHVPPFRLFLISLLIFMFVLEAFLHGSTSQKAVPSHGHIAGAASAGRTDNLVFATPDQGRALIDKMREAKTKGRKIEVTTTTKDGVATFAVNGEPVQATSAADALDKAGLEGRSHESALKGWLTEHIKRAAANREYYFIVLFTWAHRLAIMLLPILAALLALVYVRRRQFFIYDHLIVAMQFLSFVFLIFALAWLIPDPVRGWAIMVASLWAPVNLYMTLRGAYDSRWFTAGLKTLFLWFSTLFLFGLLMLGLMTLALAEM